MYVGPLISIGFDGNIHPKRYKSVNTHFDTAADAGLSMHEIRVDRLHTSWVCSGQGFKIISIVPASA